MSERYFPMATNLRLPASAVTQKFAFLGVSGSGKTYGAGVLVEGLVDIGAQVVVIDTVGNWWGLRVGKDGKGPGLKIPVIGGDRGDLPLAPTHGELIATTVASTKSSLVVDVSDFEDGELRRFVIAFAKTLLFAKKKQPSPVMIVWEECQDIIPQTMYGEDAKMVGAVQRLIKRGRNYGVGTTLISQRSAAVNKGCLNQIETMFAFRATAPLDRKAISDWVDVVGAEDAATSRGQNRPRRLTEQLPSLATGSCIVYSPHWLERLEVVSIAEKKTFNASRTPDAATRAKGELGPVDLRELEQKLAIVKQEAAENDVSALKQKIRELEARKPQKSEEHITELLELRRENTELRSRLHNTLAKFTDFVDGLAEECSRARSNMASLVEDGLRVVEPPRRSASTSVSTPKPLKSTSVPTPPGGDGSLTVMERKFLTVLAQHGRMTKSRLRTIAGYAESGPVSQTFAKIISVGWVVMHHGELELTALGRQMLGDYERLPHGDQLREYLLGSASRLSTMEKKLLEAACRSWGTPIAKGKVRELAGYAESGPVSQAFAKLIAMGYLVKADRGGVQASKELFE